jgi:hypothetical protein
VGYEYDWNTDSDLDPTEVLASTLAKIIAETAKTSSQLIFVEYPSNHFIYSVASNLLREASEKYQIPIILINTELLALCAQEDSIHQASSLAAAKVRSDTEDCPEYFRSDQHPTAKGHKVAGGLIAEKFHQLLRSL